MVELEALRLQARPVKTQNPPLVCLVCRCVAALSAGGRGTLVKGTNKVRWEDAMEFCSCPSLRTGRTYIFENRKLGLAFELFQECTDQSTRIAGYISPEQDDARSNKENQSANPNKRNQSLTQPQDSSGRKSTENVARNPPLGIIVPITSPQQVQVSPR